MMKRATKLLFLLPLSVAATAWGQGNPSLPSEPKAILQALRDANGLSLHPTVPWHLKLSWDQFDSDGDNVHSGTIEEFYVSPHRYRIIFTGDSYQQTEVATDSGLYMNNPDWPPIPALEALEFVTTPLHSFDNEPAGVRLQKSSQKFGAVSLGCINAITPASAGFSEIRSPDYCFTPGQPQLRFSRSPGVDAITYNKLGLFQKRFVAQQISASVGNRKTLDVRVDKLASLTDPDASLFMPEAGLAPITGRMKIPSGLLVVEKRGEMDWSGWQQGKATVRFVVGKDGSVIEAQALSGPEDVRKLAATTVHRFRFRPFLILDQPIEVESTMDFVLN